MTKTRLRGSAASACPSATVLGSRFSVVGTCPLTSTCSNDSIFCGVAVLEDLEVRPGEIADGLAVNGGKHVHPHEIGAGAEGGTGAVRVLLRAALRGAAILLRNADGGRRREGDRQSQHNARRTGR